MECGDLSKIAMQSNRTNAHGPGKCTRIHSLKNIHVTQKLVELPAYIEHGVVKTSATCHVISNSSVTACAQNSNHDVCSHDEKSGSHTARIYDHHEHSFSAPMSLSYPVEQIKFAFFDGDTI